MTALFYALVAVIVWSTAAAVGVSASVSLTPLEFSAMIVVSAVVSLLTINFKHLKVATQNLKALPVHAKILVVLFGLMVSGYYICFYSGLFYAPSVQANVINYLWPIIYTIVASISFRNQYRFSFYKTMFVFLGFLGAVLLMFDSPGDLGLMWNTLSPWYLASLGAAILAGLYLVISQYLQKFSFENRFLFLFGLIFSSPLLITGAFYFGNTGMLDLFYAAPYALYLGAIVIPVGQIAWANAIRLFKSPSISAVSFLTPVLSTILVITVHGTNVSALGFFGAVLVFFSALLVTSEHLYTSAQISAATAAVLTGIAILFNPPEYSSLTEATTSGSLGTIFSVLASFTIYRLADRLRERDNSLLALGSCVRKLEYAAVSQQNSSLLKHLKRFRKDTLSLDAGVGNSDHVHASALILLESLQTIRSEDIEDGSKSSSEELRHCLDRWLTHYHQKTSSGELAVISTIGALSIISAVLIAEKAFFPAIIICVSSGAVAYIVSLIRDYENHVAERDFPKINAMYRSFFSSGTVIWPSEVLESPFMKLPFTSVTVQVDTGNEIIEQNMFGLSRIARVFLILSVFAVIILLAIAIDRTGSAVKIIGSP